MSLEVHHVDQVGTESRTKVEGGRRSTFWRVVRRDLVASFGGSPDRYESLKSESLESDEEEADESDPRRRPDPDAEAKVSSIDDEYIATDLKLASCSASTSGAVGRM